MNTSDLIFILDAQVQQDREATFNYQHLKELLDVAKVKSLAEALNAEQEDKKGIIWDSKDLDQLQELRPVKPEYGWRIVSINIPVYVYIRDASELNDFKNIQVNGFIFKDFALMTACQKKIETLKGE